MGDADDPAGRTIDADGLVACPGFVDPHTHYDAQFFWDPWATPSNLFGVTSLIGGNCGFTLAPLGGPADAEYLKKMMVKVEGMALEALDAGVPWDWSSFGDYLDAVQARRPAVNVGFMVGHCALRRAVMGDRAVGSEAGPEETAAMRALLGESLAAGGLGLSTGRSFTHNDWDGRPVPSRWAGVEEVLELCRETAAHEGTTLEWVADGCMSGFRDDEVELMTQMSLAGRRPLNWNVLTVDSARPDDYRNQIAACERAAEAGARAVALTMPVLVGMNMSLGSYCALNMLPGWGEVLGLPLAERMARLRDPETLIRLENQAASPEAGVFSRLTGWADYRIGDTYSAANEGLKGRRVGDIARERGQRDFFCLVDVCLADDLRTVLWPAPTDDDPESWRLRAEVWEHEHVIIGGSDAGAHLDRMAGAGYTAAWIGDCLRGRRLTTVENAVRHLTDVPARLFGLRGPGPHRPRRLCRHRDLRPRPDRRHRARAGLRPARRGQAAVVAGHRHRAGAGERRHHRRGRRGHRPAPRRRAALRPRHLHRAAGLWLAATAPPCYLGSRGRLRTRSPRMLRMMAEVPPWMVYAGA